jgi:hypothetical protein
MQKQTMHFLHYEKNIQFLVVISSTSCNMNGYSSNSQNKTCTMSMTHKYCYQTMHFNYTKTNSYFV